MTVSLSDAGLQFADGSIQPSAHYTGYRNRIINGGFNVSQYNGNATITPTATVYSIDRWQLNVSQASKLTIQQANGSPYGTSIGNNCTVTVASQYASVSTDSFGLSQKIEGQNILDFQLGTSGAITITTSYYIKTSVAGTYSCSLSNGANNRSYVATYNIPVTGVWTKVVLTIPGDQAGSWVYDNTIGLRVWFDLGSGTNFQTSTLNTWQASNLTQATGSIQFVNQPVGSAWQITNIQIEPGLNATPFEVRPFSTELSMCQRYAFGLNSYGLGVTLNGTDGYSASIRPPITMRVFPSLLPGASCVVGAGNAGTPAIRTGAGWSTDPNLINIWNSSSNWSASTAVRITGLLSAEL